MSARIESRAEYPGTNLGRNDRARGGLPRQFGIIDQALVVEVEAGVLALAGSQTLDLSMDMRRTVSTTKTTRLQWCRYTLVWLWF